MALKSAGTEPVGDAELEAARGARGCFDCKCRHVSVSQLAVEESSDGTGGLGARRVQGKLCFSSTWVLLLLIANLSGILPRWLKNWTKKAQR